MSDRCAKLRSDAHEPVQGLSFVEAARQLSRESDMPSEGGEPLSQARRATTWPLGADLRRNLHIKSISKSLGVLEIDKSSRKKEFLNETMPASLSRQKPQTRFSLPTILELHTYERDVEFARLDDRPKRGLNLPRSKSVKPSVMSSLLLDLEEFERREADPISSPILSMASPLSSNASQTASPISSNPSSPACNHSVLSKRTASSPGTPVAMSILPKRKSRKGFFKSDD